MRSMDFHGRVATSQVFDEDQATSVTLWSNFTRTHGFIKALHFELDGHDLRTKIRILEFHLSR